MSSIPVILLDNITTTGKGITIACIQTLASGVSKGQAIVGNFTVTMVHTIGPTAISLEIQGSLDGTNWFSLASSTSTNNIMFHIANKGILSIRANITAYTQGSSTGTTVKIIGFL